MSTPERVEAHHRFAVFWGGGLGDVLVLRPLLMALAGRLRHPPLFFTTAYHLEGLFESLGLEVQLHVLPTAPLDALKVFRGLGRRLDWIYLGPHPRLKTRLLARVIGAERIWSVQHPDADVFIGEQVLADVRALDLAGPSAAALPYGGAWSKAPDQPTQGYLVFHPGAKPRWETTRWPSDHWRELIRRVLAESTLELCLVGTGSERELLDSLVADLPASSRARIRMDTQLSLPELGNLLVASRGVVCHNSGVLHLAAMLRRPTVAVTGSSARSWRPPYAHVANVTSGTCELACNQYRCPVPFYRARCIRLLEVETVMQAMRERLMAADGR
ncbi:MAG TPA: glycosyltransferase family 9 protein [Gammaproteobacteria bacterium]|jgi:hypothetical protein